MSSHLILDSAYITDQARRMGVPASEYWRELFSRDIAHRHKVIITTSADELMRVKTERMGGTYSGGWIKFFEGAGDGCEQEIAPRIKVYVFPNAEECRTQKIAARDMGLLLLSRW